MDTVWMVLGGIAGIALGLGAGFKIGELVRGRASWIYWLLNVIALVLGVSIALAGLVFGFGWLVGAALGFEGGVLTGLKYGFGRSVGLWAVHDRLQDTDKNLPRG